MKIKNILIPGLGQTQYENKTMQQINHDTTGLPTENSGYIYQKLDVLECCM